MALFEADDVVPLITHDGAAYRVDAEAAAFLQTVRTPVALVSIAGRFRTGKSALINTLCDADGAFKVGETVNACTKGIRIRKTPLHASKDVTVFVLDTEGIGSLTADSDHDTKILALSLLLSSAFLYNSVGSIDDAALQSLGLMNRVSDFIRVDADSDATDEELGAHFPKFYWVLRDFSLRLESASGDKCSEAEYLEAALADATEGNLERNQVRRSIRESFPQRALVTLPRPAENTQRLSRRTMSQAFLNGVKALRRRLLAEIEPLTAGAGGGHAITGPMLAELCAYYVQSLNKPGAVPCIRDSWTLLTELQSREAMAAVLREAQEEMRTLFKATVAPAALRRALDDVIARGVASFEGRTMQHDASRADELAADLKAEAGRYVADCQAAFDKKVEESMHLLEAAANRDDAKLGEIASLVQQALRQLEVDLGDDPHGLHLWRAKCLDNLVNAWIPKLVHTYENEQELGALASAELQSRCDEAERVLGEARAAMAKETERLRRDAELQVESSTVALQMQLDAKDADLRDERERNDALEKLLTEVRLELATLNARAASEHGEEEEEDGEGGAGGAAAGATSHPDAEEGDEGGALLADRHRLVELETEVRSLGDEVRELRTIRDTLASECAKERTEREKIELAFQQRLQALQSKQNDVVQKLRKEHDEAVRKARDEAAAAAQKEGEWRRELAVAQQQASRAEALRDEGEQTRQREIRACQEGQLTMRAMCEDLQVRMVEMQRASLEDLREREQRHRDKLAEAMTEQLQTQMQRGEAQRREERALSEVRELKRKVTTSDEAQRDAKRLREAAEEHKARGDQLGTENDRLRVRLEEAINERERLRAEHITATSERAALKRELELIRAEARLHE